MITKNLGRSFFLAAMILIYAVLTPTCAAAARPGYNSQDRPAVRQRTQEINAELQEKKAENKAFLDRFRSLPPEERIKIWKESNDNRDHKSIAYRLSDKIQDLLTIEGTDTVPYLAAIVRDHRESYFYRFWAMRILANMDRYVPEEGLPKGAVVTLGVDELKLRGTIDPFLQITGRRIGDQGRQTLQWAANGADDKWLRFVARDDLGLVKEELNGLSIDEQVRRWRDAIAQAKGTAGKPESFVGDILGRSIVERAPDSLTPLIESLNHDKDGVVRRAIVGLIREIDAYRFRLRRTDLGRSAIEAVHKAVVGGAVKLDCPKCDTPAQAWAEISRQFFKDDFGLSPGSLGAYYAQMLHTLYGENTIRVAEVGSVIKQEWATPEFTDFITYLTDKDPFFPSWEYTFFGPSYSEAFHPQFQAKMARIEDAWKQFKAGQLTSSKNH